MLLDKLAIVEPFNKVLRVVLYVAAAFIVIYALLGLVGARAPVGLW